jgi:hypothetical protein
MSKNFKVHTPGPKLKNITSGNTSVHIQSHDGKASHADINSKIHQYRRLIETHLPD